MLLVFAKVGPFKSIDLAQLVEVNERVTVLVGMNEAGKTVFLQALEKSQEPVAMRDKLISMGFKLREI